MHNAGLILNPTRETPETQSIRPTGRECLCERLAPYGLLCRACHWRIMTPPPLHGTPDPVDRHSQAPAHGPVGTFEALYSPREGHLQAVARVARFDRRQADQTPAPAGVCPVALEALRASAVDGGPVAYNLRD